VFEKRTPDSDGVEVSYFIQDAAARLPVVQNADPEAKYKTAKLPWQPWHRISLRFWLQDSEVTPSTAGKSTPPTLIINHFGDW
jgi:hypothetical protein